MHNRRTKGKAERLRLLPTAIPPHRFASVALFDSNSVSKPLILTEATSYRRLNTHCGAEMPQREDTPRKDERQEQKEQSSQPLGFPARPRDTDSARRQQEWLYVCSAFPAGAVLSAPCRSLPSSSRAGQRGRATPEASGCEEPTRWRRIPHSSLRQSRADAGKPPESPR